MKSLKPEAPFSSASDGVFSALSNEEAAFFVRHALHNNGLPPLKLSGADAREPREPEKAGEARRPRPRERERESRSKRLGGARARAI